MDEDGPNVLTDAQVQSEIKSTRATVRAVGTIVLAIGLASAYLIWPNGVTDLPLGSISFGAFLRAIGAGVVAVVFCVVALMLAWD